MPSPLLLGVNIDHVATLRQARGTAYPDPVRAALEAEDAGADLITLHLREDRRHIQEADVRTLRSRLRTRMNLESALQEDMIAFILDVRPQDVCLVPERREERTTEGGLNVKHHRARLTEVSQLLRQEGIRVALFIESDMEALQIAVDVGVPVVELHTGRYADATSEAARQHELLRLQQGATFAASQGLEVHAGHGLNLDNVQPIAAIPQVVELNIGHAIVADAVFCGWRQAITQMKTSMRNARP